MNLTPQTIIRTDLSTCPYACGLEKHAHHIAICPQETASGCIVTLFQYDILTLPMRKIQGLPIKVLHFFLCPVPQNTAVSQQAGSNIKTEYLKKSCQSSFHRRFFTVPAVCDVCNTNNSHKITDYSIFALYNSTASGYTSARLAENVSIISVSP